MQKTKAYLRRITAVAAAAAFTAAFATAVNAEPQTVRIAKQYGISYLPLTDHAGEKTARSGGQEARPRS